MNSGEFLVTGSNGMGSVAITLDNAKFDGVEFLDNEVSIEQKKARFDGREVTVVFEGVTDADNQLGQMPRGGSLLNRYKQYKQIIEPMFSSIVDDMSLLGRVIPGFSVDSKKFMSGFNGAVAVKAEPQSQCLSKMVPSGANKSRPLANLLADYYLEAVFARESARIDKTLQSMCDISQHGSPISKLEFESRLRKEVEQVLTNEVLAEMAQGSMDEGRTEQLCVELTKRTANIFSSYYSLNKDVVIYLMNWFEVSRQAVSEITRLSGELKKDAPALATRRQKVEGMGIDGGFLRKKREVKPFSMPSKEFTLSCEQWPLQMATDRAGDRLKTNNKLIDILKAVAHHSTVAGDLQFKLQAVTNTILSNIKEAAGLPPVPAHEKTPKAIRSDFGDIDGVYGCGIIHGILQVHIKPKNGLHEYEIYKAIKKVLDRHGWKKGYKVANVLKP